MILKFFTVLVAPFLAALGVSTPAFAGESDEIAIRQIEATWVQASMHQDRDTLAALLDDSYRGITPSGVARSKSDVLGAPPAPAGSTQTLRDLAVRVDGDHAVATGENHFMAPNGQAVVFAFRDDFVRRDGQWRVVGSWMTRQ